jgi:putative PIN family toxin of toxin-antitoxin system
MTVKAVIDTNIWVSSLLNPFGFPAKLRKAFENRLFIPIISEIILEELMEVLRRPRIKDKYGLADEEIRDLLILIEERAESVIPSGTIHLCRDKDDDLIIETAIKGKAEYLVTRDDDLKWDIGVSSYLKNHGVTVTSVSKFLSAILKI